MKNQKPAVGNVSCIDRNHAPLAILALVAVFRKLREERGLSLNRRDASVYSCKIDWHFFAPA
jgi:hypothetical protein